MVVRTEAKEMEEMKEIKPEAPIPKQSPKSKKEKDIPVHPFFDYPEGVKPLREK